MADEGDETQSVEEEAEQSAEMDLAEAHRVKDSMQHFINSSAWEIIRAHLERGIQTRRNQYELTPLENLLEVGKQEFVKGEIAEARLVLELPLTLLNTALATIEIEAQIEEAKKADIEETDDGGQPKDRDDTDDDTDD